MSPRKHGSIQGKSQLMDPPPRSMYQRCSLGQRTKKIVPPCEIVVTVKKLFLVFFYILITHAAP